MAHPGTGRHRSSRFAIGRIAVLWRRLGAGVGMMSVAFPLAAADFRVGTGTELRNAITNAAPSDSITFTANIETNSRLPQVTTNLTINGGNFTL